MGSRPIIGLHQLHLELDMVREFDYGDPIASLPFVNEPVAAKEAEEALVGTGMKLRGEPDGKALLNLRGKEHIVGPGPGNRRGGGTVRFGAQGQGGTELPTGVPHIEHPAPVEPVAEGVHDGLVRQQGVTRRQEVREDPLEGLVEIHRA